MTEQVLPACPDCGSDGKRWIRRPAVKLTAHYADDLPFAGSGTTIEACVIEGFRCIAVEREPDYLPLILQRLSKPIQPTLDVNP